MGGKDFYKIVTSNNRSIDDLFDKLSDLSSFEGKTMAIDAPYFIYRSLKIINDATRLTDAEGNITNHIKAILDRILMMKKLNIGMIWVFDNPTPNVYKAEESKKRKATKEKSNNDKVKISMTSQHIEEIQTILKFLGITYATAPQDVEGEHLAAQLTKNNEYCDYVLSGDSDILAFGGNLLRFSNNPFNPDKKMKTFYQQINFADLVSKLGMDTFIAKNEGINIDDPRVMKLARADLCRLSVSLGNDFVDKTPRVTKNTVLNKYFNNSLSFNEKQCEIINYMIKEVTIVPELFTTSEKNIEGLIEYLSSKNFDIARYRSKLNDF
jgi:hypothetical protein